MVPNPIKECQEVCKILQIGTQNNFKKREFLLSNYLISFTQQRVEITPNKMNEMGLIRVLVFLIDFLL